MSLITWHPIDLFESLHYTKAVCRIFISLVDFQVIIEETVPLFVIKQFLVSIFSSQSYILLCCYLFQLFFDKLFALFFPYHILLLFSKLSNYIEVLNFCEASHSDQ